MLSDTHCHLNFDAFDSDREVVLSNARKAGVDRILNPGVDLPSSREAIALSEYTREVYAAVGVHPNDLQPWEENMLESLRELASHEKVVAIGEIGLDYYRERTPHDEQKRAFQSQLRLAADLSLPVVVHTRNTSSEDRRAITDALEILREWRMSLLVSNPALAENPGVLHSFSGNEAEARAAIEMNFSIGITGPVTFKNAPELQHLVGVLPLEHLLVETDAPFLTPHPYRGGRNEPAFVRIVAEKIAEIQNLPFEIVASTTDQNAERLFHWRANH